MSSVDTVVEVLLKTPEVARALARVGVFVVDHRRGERSYTADHFEMGLDEGSFGGADGWLDLVHPEDRDRVEGHYQELLEGKTDVFSTEYRFRRADGDYEWIQNMGTVVYRQDDGRPLLYLGADTNVSKLKRVEARLAELALRDPVLGILNRRGLETRGAYLVDAARRTGRTLGVLIIDLDDFKVINDELGHTAADELMRSFADNTLAVVRSMDVFARYGGDEFVVMVPEADEAELKSVAERIGASLTGVTHPSLRKPFSVTQGGMACVPSDGQELADLIGAADLAMYQAKRERKGGIYLRSKSSAGTRSGPTEYPTE